MTFCLPTSRLTTGNFLCPKQSQLSTTNSVFFMLDTVGAELVWELEIIGSHLQNYNSWPYVSTCSTWQLCKDFVNDCCPHFSMLITELERRPSVPICLLIKSWLWWVFTRVSQTDLGAGMVRNIITTFVSSKLPRLYWTVVCCVFNSPG